MFLIKVEGSEGEIDNVCYLILRTLIISLVNIVDLVLAIIAFDSNCITYFVLKYVSFFFSFLMWLTLCCSYSYTNEDFEGIMFIIPGIILVIIYLALEIPVLVFFIMYYKDLVLIALIGYFVHLITIPAAIILMIKECYS